MYSAGLVIRVLMHVSHHKQDFKYIKHTNLLEQLLIKSQRLKQSSKEWSMTGKIM